MDNAARTRQRVLAIFLSVTAVLYISAEALSPKGTDQVISTTATALKVLPIAARHPAQLYVAGSLALLGLGGLAVSYAAIAALVRNRGSALATVAALIGGLGAFCGAITNVLVYPNLAAAATAHLTPGRRPADFGEYRDQVVASLRRPGYVKAFSATTRTSHDPAEARLADVTAPALVVMASRIPTSLTRGRRATGSPAPCAPHVVMVSEAGHYPQSQRPGITTGAVLRFLESVQGRA
jgi:pimeloyl-ACP methyl ester carboxylesterase